MRVIYQKLNYRIIEVLDEVTTFEDLIGDCFCPVTNPEIDKGALESDLRKFKRRWDSESVYGYIVQQWNPEIDCGWEEIEACYGFLGTYDKGAEDYNHDIVEEFKGLIDSQKNNY